MTCRHFIVDYTRLVETKFIKRSLSFNPILPAAWPASFCSSATEVSTHDEGKPVAWGIEHEGVIVWLHLRGWKTPDQLHEKLKNVVFHEAIKAVCVLTYSGSRGLYTPPITIGIDAPVPAYFLSHPLKADESASVLRTAVTALENLDLKREGLRTGKVTPSGVNAWRRSKETMQLFNLERDDPGHLLILRLLKNVGQPVDCLLKLPELRSTARAWNGVLSNEEVESIPWDIATEFSTRIWQYPFGDNWEARMTAALDCWFQERAPLCQHYGLGDELWEDAKDRAKKAVLQHVRAWVDDSGSAPSPQP